MGTSRPPTGPERRRGWSEEELRQQVAEFRLLRDAKEVARPSVKRVAPFPVALVADASADVRNLYTTALDEIVGEFAYAQDGREALVKALANPPSVLITDARLAFIDGYELCALLRRDTATRAMPIVMVTDAVLTVEIRRAEMAGADIVLAKPGLPETLRVALERLSERWLATSNAIDPSRARQRSRTRTHQRGATTSPPLTPPTLICPSCDRVLQYLRSEIGGVSATHSEQWDYLQCESGCGTFQYRQRTRKLLRT